MIKVAHFRPRDEWEVAYWYDVCRCFGAEEIVVEDTAMLLAQPSLYTFCPDGEVSLHDLNHPEDGYYLFGPDHFKADYRGGTTVRIPQLDVPTNLWSFQAVVAVLYDRQVKRGY